MEQGLSLEIIKGKISLQAKADQLQKLLQAGEDINFTEENINAPCEILDKLIEVYKNVDGIENPFTKDWKNFNLAKTSIAKPLEDLIARKRNEKGKVAKKMQDDKKKIDDESFRIAQIKAIINTRTLDFSQKIASATTPEELVAIEKAIGSEKARKNVYQDLIPNLIIALDELTPLIKAQKGSIKELQNLNEQISEAAKKEDDESLLGLMVKEEELLNKIENSKTEVQLTAINSATKNEVVEVENTVVLPKARRTTWEWEVTDIEKLSKKFPQFVMLEVNKDAIDKYVRVLKETKSIKEYNEGGLMIYLKSIY